MDNEKKWVYGLGVLLVVVGIFLESRDFYMSYWLGYMVLGAGGGIIGVNFMNRYHYGKNHPDEMDMEIYRRAALRSFQVSFPLTGIAGGILAFTDLSMPGTAAFSIMFLVLSLSYAVPFIYYRRRI